MRRSTKMRDAIGIYTGYIRLYRYYRSLSISLCLYLACELLSESNVYIHIGLCYFISLSVVMQCPSRARSQTGLDSLGIRIQMTRIRGISIDLNSPILPLLHHIF